MKKFFDYIQLPNFDIAADAAATFKVVLKFQPTCIFSLSSVKHAMITPTLYNMFFTGTVN